jgi:2-oxoisovalerate dehydrogenase E1 component
MYNNQVRVPLIIRTPMGGRRGYGPTHSQSLEKHFLGVPDLLVVAINHRIDPALIYQILLSSDLGPTLVIENKVLYGQRIPSAMPDGFVLEVSEETLPSLRIRPQGVSDVTIVCYGEMLREVEEAIMLVFDDHEIICEVICPTQLSPLNIAGIESSVRQSTRLLIVEEGAETFGFGSEVAAAVAERNKGISIRRLAAPAIPVPACAMLEQEILPNRESIVKAIVELSSRG